MTSNIFDIFIEFHFIEDIYLLEDGIWMEDLPEVTIINNDTFCFKPELKAYLRCFLSNFSEPSAMTMNRSEGA